MADTTDFIAYFSIIPDPRVERTKKHKLIDILFIAVCTIICGGEDFTDMELFGEAKQEWLRTLLELPHGIPSHDTFGRVFSLIDPQAFGECFLRWGAALHEATRGEVIALDGKTLRHSFDNATGQSALHLVSAWASENGITLGQLKVDGKSNEITALPALLKMLEVKGCVVTMDAMGCQKDLARQIVQQGGDYVLCLKGNQGSLHEETKCFFEEANELVNLARMTTLRANRLQVVAEQVVKRHGSLPYAFQPARRPRASSRRSSGRVSERRTYPSPVAP